MDVRSIVWPLLPPATPRDWTGNFLGSLPVPAFCIPLSQSLGKQGLGLRDGRWKRITESAAALSQAMGGAFGE